MENKNVNRLTQCAMIAALAYVGFQFLRIDIPVGTERTAIHLGNTMVVLGALLLGSWGGFAGALGLTIADFCSQDDHRIDHGPGLQKDLSSGQ